jgi:hypothetical protein
LCVRSNEMTHRVERAHDVDIGCLVLK